MLRLGDNASSRGRERGLDQAVANLNCGAAVSSFSVLPRRAERLPLMPESNPEM
jgi:hypothetical protein